MERDSLEGLANDVIHCRACPRLVSWREEVAVTKRRAYRDWDYWGRPVMGFGDPDARLLVLGMAPGAHGANRTGRPFTGDGSGEFLYAALHRAGFANQPHSLHREDGLRLLDCYVSGVVRCVPPKNRPNAAEIQCCRPFLLRELSLLPRVRVILALGQIAFDAFLRGMREAGHDLPRLKFGHGAEYELGDDLPYLISSYHPSRQNTNTGRLTAAMMDNVLDSVSRRILASEKAST